MLLRLLSCALTCAAIANAATLACDALAAHTLPGGTITAAAVIAADSTATPDGIPLNKAPAFCRVQGVLTPSADSHVRFEVWLPEDSWNGRFLGVGNGGFAGSIDYRALAGNIARGFATAATDTGHQAEAVDGSWAYGHPEQIVDFGYRALHLTVETAKSLLAAYYGKPQEHAYFDSCSNGGREALMEAQRFPADFDGILAGAPAYDFAHTTVTGLTMGQALFGDPKSYISAVKIPALRKAALAACDGADGLRDGVIGNPERCRFDPSVLSCTGLQSKDCLTPAQLKSARKLYGLEPGAVPRSTTAPYIAESGRTGYVAGAEEGPGGWRPWILGEAPGLSSGAGFVQSFFRYLVFNDPAWNLLKADPADAEKKASGVAGSIDATDPNLQPFFSRGGKLILYHGWNDPALSPWVTLDYFRAVQSTVGAQPAAQAMRLYFIPGMQHCVGGPGATFFGQLGLPTSEGDRFGIFDTLQHWVENGTAPDAITATKWTDDNPGKPADFTRPVCAYPTAPEYDGKGDPKAAKSFACR